MFGFGSVIQPSSIAKECAMLQEWKPKFRNIIYVLQQQDGWGGVGWGLPRCWECGGWSFGGRPAGFQEAATHTGRSPWLCLFGRSALLQSPAGCLHGPGAPLLLLVHGERPARCSSCSVQMQSCFGMPASPGSCQNRACPGFRNAHSETQYTDFFLSLLKINKRERERAQNMLL